MWNRSRGGDMLDLGVPSSRLMDICAHGLADLGTAR